MVFALCSVCRMEWCWLDSTKVNERMDGSE